MTTRASRNGPALRRNDGPRAIARVLRLQCGMTRAAALEVMRTKKWKKSDHSPRRALTPGAQEVFWSALQDGVRDGWVTRDCAKVLALCLVYGLRIAEAVTVSGDSLRRGQLHVVGKGSKARAIPLDIDPEGPELSRMLPERAHLCNAAQAQRVCRRLAEQYPELAGLTPHVLRHTYASNALHTCVDLSKLQSALGHTSIKTTRTYLHSLSL